MECVTLVHNGDVHAAFVHVDVCVVCGTWCDMRCEVQRQRSRVQSILCEQRFDLP